MCAHQHTYNYNILLRKKLMVVLKSRFETWPQFRAANTPSRQLQPEQHYSSDGAWVPPHYSFMFKDWECLSPCSPYSHFNPPPSHGTHTLPYLADSLPTPTSVDHLIDFHTHKLGHSAHLIPEYHHFCVALRRLQRTVHILDD